MKAENRDMLTNISEMFFPLSFDGPEAETKDPTMIDKWELINQLSEK